MFMRNGTKMAVAEIDHVTWYANRPKNGSFKKRQKNNFLNGPFLESMCISGYVTYLSQLDYFELFS